MKEEKTAELRSQSIYDVTAETLILFYDVIAEVAILFCDVMSQLWLSFSSMKSTTHQVSCSIDP